MQKTNFTNKKSASSNALFYYAILSAKAAIIELTSHILTFSASHILQFIKVLSKYIRFSRKPLPD